MKNFIVQYSCGLFLADAPMYATEFASFAKRLFVTEAARASSFVPGSRIVTVQHAAGSYCGEDLRDSEMFQAVL